MKELTIKEKAEAYDYAVNKAKELILNENGVVRVDKPLFDELFPSEMEESEDERIRKRIYDYINVTLDDNESEEKEKWLAFLSKQGGEQILANSAKTCKDEQKPANKVEPKFKVGYWVVTDKCDTVQIGAVNNGYYTLYNGMIFNVSYVDKCWHLWSIADAKDGDVLACENGWICIFRCLNDNLFSSHCFMDDEGWFCEYGGQGHTLDNSICGEIHPATKEQRDILFAKMKEAGYEWDDEKKELKKIEPKQEWSEEDKRIDMTTQQKRDKYTEFGKGWCEHGLVDIDPYEHHGKTSIGVNIGEERFDTDPYSRKDFALCEAKGWLEGVKAQIEGVLESINKEIEEIPL